MLGCRCYYLYDICDVFSSGYLNSKFTICFSHSVGNCAHAQLHMFMQIGWYVANKRNEVLFNGVEYLVTIIFITNIKP